MPQSLPVTIQSRLLRVTRLNISELSSLQWQKTEYLLKSGTSKVSFLSQVHQALSSVVDESSWDTDVMQRICEQTLFSNFRSVELNRNFSYIFTGVSHLYASLISTNPGPMDPASSKNESDASPRAISLSVSQSNKVSHPMKEVLSLTDCA